MMALGFLLVVLACSATAIPASTPDVATDINKLASGTSELASSTAEVADAVTKSLKDAEGEVADKKAKLDGAKIELDQSKEALAQKSVEKKAEAKAAVDATKAKGSQSTTIVDKYSKDAQIAVNTFNNNLRSVFSTLKVKLPKLAASSSSMTELVQINAGEDVLTDVKAIASSTGALADDTKKVADAVQATLKKTDTAKAETEAETKKLEASKEDELAKTMDDVSAANAGASAEISAVKNKLAAAQINVGDSKAEMTKYVGILKEQLDAIWASMSLDMPK
jgi:X-X-X-Leu-X-X-Gly heptad repeat protein